jgi:hypothetical protein
MVIEVRSDYENTFPIQSEYYGAEIWTNWIGFGLDLHISSVDVFVGMTQCKVCWSYDKAKVGLIPIISQSLNTGTTGNYRSLK